MIVLTLGVSCSSPKDGTDIAAVEKPSEGNNSVNEISILSLWQNANATKTLDFRQLILNQTMPSDLMLVCTGTFGNNGKVNGMNRGEVKLSGTAQSGYLFVGHLKYVGGPATCSAMSKEIYSYTITNATLTFCALNWDSCSTYTLAP